MIITNFQLIDLTAIFEINAGIFPVSLQNYHHDNLTQSNKTRKTW